MNSFELLGTLTNNLYINTKNKRKSFVLWHDVTFLEIFVQICLDSIS